MSKECLSCGEDNTDSAVVCKNCGGRSFSTETPDAAPVLIMTDRKSDKVIIISGNCLIGREGDIEAEFFAEDMHISRNHCKVILENGEYKIEHLPTAKNPTKINNVSLSRGVRSIIRNGDYLTIADKTFEISLSLCQDAVCAEAAQQAAAPADNDSAGKTKYVIICPKCGSEYEVDNIEARINECGNCDDYDKGEISRIGARVKYAD